jgi:ubiquinone/menaquinone biosynthesis C-methylase UbiE
MTTTLKDEVRDFWDAASCGEVYAQGDTLQQQYEAQARSRYVLEPYIADFAQFPSGTGKDVLEIGVGMGADHVEWAKSRPRTLTGIDLTPRAIEHTRTRLGFLGLQSNLRVGDAERLPFDNDSFDIVYSWGVIHHSPDTPKAFAEVHRVLRPGGTARIMIYHRRSIMSVMLWLRYALLAGKPWRTFTDVLAHHLESPGTKAYTVAETREMTRAFSGVDIRPYLSFGDLLQGEVGQRHRGPLLRVAKALWPRPLIRATMGRFGMQLFITAVK